MIQRSPDLQIPVGELIDMLRTTAPMEQVLEGREPLPGFQNIYEINQAAIDESKATLIAYMGPSGAGQDTLSQRLHQLGYNCPSIRTATTRPRRVGAGESPDAYIWMEPPEYGTEDCLGWLAAKYSLLEVQNHSGHYYGLPRQSVEESLRAHPDQPLLVKSDPRGLTMLRKNAGEEFNVVGLAVLPDDYSQLWDRIGSRSSQPQRMIDSLRFAVEVTYITDYVIRNREDADDPEGGITFNALELGRLLEHIKAGGGN